MSPSSSVSKQQVSRRAVLRGIGAAVALPWLDSAARAAGTVGSLAAPVEVPPTRMAYIFVPNGVHLDRWTPTREGTDFEMPPILEPLNSLREDLLVISGLTHDKGRANGDGAGDHARSASVFLTGSQPVKTNGADIRSGISVDQVAARAIGKNTRLPSLELAIDQGRNSGNCDSGYSCAYSFNISWAGESTPMSKETSPRQVFDRLFAGGSSSEVARQTERRNRRRKSILDFVLSESRSLQHRLGARDRMKVDEYFQSVRELERRVARAEDPRNHTEVAEPEGLDLGERGRLPWEDHVRLMSDLQVLAFQTDVTRISTFMFANAGSNRNYRQIGVSDGHHELSHHGRNPEKLEKIERINTFHIQQLAYFLERLKAIPEGEGTLLDHSMIVYGSGLSDGNAHNNENLPVLLAGRGGGTVDTGRHVRVPEETPMCNLFLSMLERMGVEQPHFGDSTGTLEELTL